jgi:hypothetical protein
MIIIPRVSMPKMDDQQVTLRSTCRHVVALVGNYETLDEQGKPVGPPKPYSYTGTVLENSGHWYLGTSGHVITKMKKDREHSRIRILGSYLSDQYGLDCKSEYPIGFNPFDQAIYVADRPEDVGIDFALIYLRP